MKKKFYFTVLVCFLFLIPKVHCQTNNAYLKSGTKFIGSSIITIGLGLLAADLLERSANSTMIDNNDKALKTFNSAVNLNPSNTYALTTYNEAVKKNSETYQSAFKTAIYIRAGSAVVGVVLALVGIDCINKDGTVTVAANSNSKLTFGVGSTSATLCYSF